METSQKSREEAHFPYINIDSSEDLNAQETRLEQRIAQLRQELVVVRAKMGRQQIVIAVPGKRFSLLSRDLSEHVTDEVFNAASHMVGAMLSLLGSVYLVAKSSADSNPWAIVAFSIYGLSLINLFVSSSLHHSLHGSSRFNRNLRMLDFLSIYPMIAGTYTPLCMIFLHGTVTGWVFLGCIWLIAGVGMTLTILFFPEHLPKWVPFVFYITMGCIGVFVIWALEAYSYMGVSGVLLFLGGGAAYTVGGIFYTLEKPSVIIANQFGFHEIWHFMILLGSALHYALMYFYVLPEARKLLEFH